MRVAGRFVVLALSVLTLVAGNAAGDVVFFDDFEGHVAATSWVEFNDRDPGAPPVGGGWTIDEGSDETKVQVMESPVSSAFYAFDTPYGSKFLHQWRDTGDGGAVWAGIDAAGQTAISTNGTMQVSFDFHTVVGPDGWGRNYNLAGFDSGVNSYTGRAFDVSFRANGDVLTYVGGSSLSQPTLAAEYVQNGWNHVVIDVDFVTDTWAITVGNATVSGLTFGATIDEALNISKIQHVNFGATDAGGVAGRMGLDNLLVVTPIPEPSGLCLAGLGMMAAVSMVRRQKRA